jgi:hypothetical protein
VEYNEYGSIDISQDIENDSMVKDSILEAE